MFTHPVLHEPSVGFLNPFRQIAEKDERGYAGIVQLRDIFYFHVLSLDGRRGFSFDNR